jgi:hypothetical protein
MLDTCSCWLYGCIYLSRATLFNREVENVPHYLAVFFQKPCFVKSLEIDIKAECSSFYPSLPPSA